MAEEVTTNEGHKDEPTDAPAALRARIEALEACIGELLKHQDEATVERCQKLLNP